MTKKREILIKQLWNDLVESAFDFFEKAISEHEKEPKYAVLHLAASVELFLKSRLMAEHWSLIFDNETKINFDKFRNGDFKSIMVHNVIEKLNGILPGDLQVSLDAAKEFEELAKERNKIAHFFHSKLNDKKLQEKIVSQQCRVWYYIHGLIGNTWKKEYKIFSERLSDLSQKMQEQRKFLEEKFNIIRPDLDIFRKKTGIDICECPACKFEALVVEEDQNVFSYARCKICNKNNRVLKIICSECDSSILLEYGDDSCNGYDNNKNDWCHHQFSPDELAEILGISKYSQDDFYRHDIYCPYCETGSVYPTRDDYACLSCFELFVSIDACEWCNEYWAGELEEGTHYFGCPNCEGYSGHTRDRD